MIHRWLEDCESFILRRGFWYSVVETDRGTYVTAVMDARKYMEKQQVLLDAGYSKSDLMKNIIGSIEQFGLKDR